MIIRLLQYSLVFALVWLGVIIWWQETNRAVSAEDVMVWMGLAPVAAIAGFQLLRWSYRVATRPAAEVPAAEASADDGAGGTATRIDITERTFRLAVVATAFSGMAGDSAEAAAAALASPDTEPKLDTTVRDADGFPVRTARVASLDTEAALAWLDRAQVSPDMLRVGDRERLLRCLALLEMALPRLIDSLSPLFPAIDPQAARPTPPRRLSIRLVAPDRLDSRAIAAIESCIGQRIAEAGWGPVALDTQSIPVGVPHDAVAMLDRFVTVADVEATSDVLLLIGTDSALDEETLAEWSRNDRFHCGRHPSGLIPGEAAAAVALMRPTAVPPDLAPVARLHRIAIGQREQSADARGRTSGALLTTLCTQAIDAAELQPEACSVVMTDAATVTSRHAEAALMMTSLLPDLDAVADRLNLGAAFGELGAAGLPALLALSAARCLDTQLPVLAAGVADARLRFASMLTPADTEPATAQA